MAVLPTSQRLSKEDIKGAPAWIDGLLNFLNTFALAVYNALNGALTFGDNIQAQIKDLTFTTSSSYSAGDFTAIKFTRSFKTKAQGLRIMQITKNTDNYEPILNAVSLEGSWRDLSGDINIYYVAGLEDEQTYQMKVLVI